MDARLSRELDDEPAIVNFGAARAAGEISRVVQRLIRIGAAKLRALAPRAMREHRPDVEGELLVARPEACTAVWLSRAPTNSIALKNACSGICARPDIQRSSVFSGTRNRAARACVLPSSSAACCSTFVLDVIGHGAKVP